MNTPAVTANLNPRTARFAWPALPAWIEYRIILAGMIIALVAGGALVLRALAQATAFQ